MRWMTLLALAVAACGGGEDGSSTTSACGQQTDDALRCGTTTWVTEGPPGSTGDAPPDTDGGWCSQFDSDASCQENDCTWEYENDRCVEGPGTGTSETATGTSDGTAGSDTGTSTSTGTSG